jgi:superfamily II DNA or RNA helicase
MEPLPEHGGIELRFYQHEMLEASMKSNVVVAMDTGSGKTHVAIARIRRELEGSNSTKVRHSLPILYSYCLSF